MHMWWFHQDYAVNSWYTGIVLRLSPYGAFVAVKSGSGWAEGLVKTNQIQGDDLEVAAEVWMKNGDGFCHVFGKDMVEKDEIWRNFMIVFAWNLHIMSTLKDPKGIVYSWSGV